MMRTHDTCLNFSYASRSRDFASIWSKPGNRSSAASGRGPVVLLDDIAALSVADGDQMVEAVQTIMLDVMLGC